jgi:hypothetical protein
MIENEIKQLISLKQEGGYWDFKKQWYVSGDAGKRSLLIDIICMANNLENRDAYIIIGVDEANDYACVDVAADSNRRTTQNVVEFLKDKSFMGGTRPLVRVESVSVDDSTLDVIVIQNSYNTLFTLTKDYRGVKAHHIYTRIQDVNTAHDSSADIDKVEYLYRKRFRINEAPLEKIEYYLQDVNGWEESNISSGYEFYYKHAPEQFTIRFKNDHESEDCEFWSLMFPASGRRNNSLQDIEIKWNGLVLSSDYRYASLDDGRGHSIMPELGSIQISDKKYYRYFYLIKGTLRYSLYEFVWAKIYSTDLPRYRGAIEGHFIIFNDIDELERFKYKVVQQKEVIATELDAERAKPENQHLEAPGFYYGFNNLDAIDYVDSRYFVSKFIEFKSTDY